VSKYNCWGEREFIEELEKRDGAAKKTAQLLSDEKIKVAVLELELVRIGVILGNLNSDIKKLNLRI